MSKAGRGVEPQAAVHGFSARRLGVAQNDVYAVGCLAAGEKLKGECLGHLAYDDAPLVKPIVACEHLAAGNALGFRLIGFYIGYGDALTPVGVIYEQLRVNAEGLVQHVFTGVGDVSHGQYAEACEPCGCAAAYTPEIRYRAVIPQLLAVARLVKLADEIRSVL